MNKIQKEIINELRVTAKKLKKSPTKRDAPGLSYQCYKCFGSFNKAKQLAGLSINDKNIPIPRNSLKLDKELTRIVSHLTFDGHLDKKLRAFHFSSNSKKELENLRSDVYKKFRLDVFKVERGSGYGSRVWKYWYFNANLCKFLYSVGTPKGDKMLTSFDIPDWIKKNKAFTKEYLKMAYFCEGSKYRHSKNTEAIRINLNKSEGLLQDGLKFMESLKSLLRQFSVGTTKTWICEGNKRKDGKITKLMAFKIKADGVNRFINKIGWLK